MEVTGVNWLLGKLASKAIGMIADVAEPVVAKIFAQEAEALALEAESEVARGSSNVLKGYFSSTTNAAGGELITSVGEITQSDFGNFVNRGLYTGQNIEILSGVHGFASGLTEAEPSFFTADVKTFGGLEGVTVHDMANMTAEQIGNIVNGKGIIIGGFCNSGVCLMPFLR